MCCYSNNGASMRAVDPNYVAQLGEVLSRLRRRGVDPSRTAALPSPMSTVLPLELKASWA
jgi:hypothetical protein